MRLLPFERRWLLSLLDAVLPRRASPTLPKGASDFPLDGFVQDLTRTAPASFGLGLRVAIWFVTWSPAFLLGRFTIAPKLSLYERIALLDRLAAHEIYLVSEVPNILKLVAALGYCGFPEIQSALHVSPSDTQPADWMPSPKDDTKRGRSSALRSTRLGDGDVAA